MATDPHYSFIFPSFLAARAATYENMFNINSSFLKNKLRMISLICGIIKFISCYWPSYCL